MVERGLADPWLDRLARAVRRLGGRLRSALGWPNSVGRARERVAALYLRGDGIEIGALHLPVKMPRGVTVRYVDRMGERDLRVQYPELRRHSLVHVDIIDDGELLSSLPDRSVDFIVANHMIEHCLDPIGTLKNWARVIRPAGVLYMAVPHRKLTFDRDRAPTPWDHLLGDHADGGAASSWAHLIEWATLVERAADPVARAQTLRDQQYSIHYHVWTDVEFRDFMERSRSQGGVNLSILDIVINQNEYIVVAQRTAGEDA